MPRRIASFLFLLSSVSASAQTTEPTRWLAEAQAVTITRDDWGIAHIHGRTDADAVFGTIYAQCEDDFNRVETNYLVALGRLAEAEGEGRLYQDLRQRLFLDPKQLQQDYTASPPWLQKLMNAWADGLNYYLETHPEVHPRVLTRFEPWMALSFTEGSIGGDIEKVDLKALQAHYEAPPSPTPGTAMVGPNNPSAYATLASEASPEPDTEAVRRLEGRRDLDASSGGSNGFAIAPANTRNRHSLLLINPHTSFFFRSELGVSSDEGLQAYGAVTWGQFFVYQGFNDRVGWMHTSSNVDAVDEFADTVTHHGTEVTYRYGTTERPFTTRAVTLSYRTPGGPQQRTWTLYYDHRGPVVREEAGHWITIGLMNKPVPALEQSFLRTKARTYAAYRSTMELMANSSNNTVYADADGNIAYWHGNFIPRRSTQYDYTRPVDGSNPDTDWQGLLTLDQVPHLFNPSSGYLLNVNNAPWWGSGESSLRRSDFPAYVEQGTETARGLHAIRVLQGHFDFTLESLRDAAFDSYLPWFARTLPRLFQAWDALPDGSAQKTQLAGQIALLRAWDDRWAADSVPTTLAVYWGEAVGLPVASAARRARTPWEEYVATQVSGPTMLDALTTASARLVSDFGSWRTPWGQVNRFQRLNDNILPSFSDTAPSIPVSFVSSQWGSLASFAAHSYPNTRRRYGSVGNSFVAVVEFGPRVRAIAVTAGGESGNPASPHFNDEATRYAMGDLRTVYFYPDQLQGHTEAVYHPGEKAAMHAPVAKHGNP